MTTSTYTQREEWLNCAVHVAGLVASCIAIPVLALAGWRSGDPWLLAGGLVFGVSALLMFTTSALYHAARDPAVRLRLRRIDHAAIYVKIAATYTPFAVLVAGAEATVILACIWTAALVGVTGDRAGAINSRKLTTYLARMEGRIIDGRRFINAGKQVKTICWMLVPI